MDRIWFHFSKLFLYIKLWGLRQTFFKTIGRLKVSFPLSLPAPVKNILVIGCGQFAFSTLAPRLLSFGIFSPIAFAYDPDKFALSKFCRAFSARPVDLSSLDLSGLGDVRLVYICSDHSSHFLYAKLFLSAGIDVYCEKPLSTSLSQIYELASIVARSSSRFFAGYNRPHSDFIRILRDHFRLSNSSRLFLNFHVSGHYLAADHWYRSSGQGSHIYGNLGHWIDLFVHTCFWFDNKPSIFSITIAYSDPHFSDENLVVQITDNDRIFASISFACLVEPITGVNETLLFSTDKFIARIYNFKSMELDTVSSYRVFSKRLKSAGHLEAVGQPFKSVMRPDIEPFVSEILLSKIQSLVSSRSVSGSFDLESELKELYSRV